MIDSTQGRLSNAIRLARSAAVAHFALVNSRDISTDAKLREVRQEFYSQPYELRATYHKRPTKEMVSDDAPAERAILTRYLRTGDAAQAIDSLGLGDLPQDVEQKRIAAGMGEILEADIYPPHGGGGVDYVAAPSPPLERAAEHAADTGLYDAAGWQSHTPGPEEAVENEDLYRKVMDFARANVPAEELAIFLSATLDDMPYRKIAHEHDMGKSTVAEIVWGVTALLQEKLNELNGDT